MPILLDGVEVIRVFGILLPGHRHAASSKISYCEQFDVNLWYNESRQIRSKHALELFGFHLCNDKPHPRCWTKYAIRCLHCL